MLEFLTQEHHEEESLTVPHFARVSIVALAILQPSFIHADDRAHFLITAHKSAFDSMRTVSCKLTIDVAPLRRAVQHAESDYYYGASQLRVVTYKEDGKVDYYCKNMQRYYLESWRKGGVERFKAGRSSHPSHFLEREDAFVQGLMVLRVIGQTYYLPLWELAGRADSVETLTDGVLESKTVHRLKLTFPGLDGNGYKNYCIVYIDPSMNYLIRQAEYYQEKSGISRVQRHAIQAYKEIKDGLFFPTAGIDKYEVNSKVMVTTIIKMSGIKMNDTLPPGIFVFRFPRGLFFNDMVNEETYYIDESGNPISERKKMSRMVSSGAPNQSTATDTSPTDSGWEVNWLTLLLIAAVILIITGVILTRRRNLK